jgi:secondary thiamine-phosphate synthase enzyme
MRTTASQIETGTWLVTDITEFAASFARDASNGGDGLLHAFVPHATCGLALIETGSGSEADLGEVVGRLLPRDDRYAHRHGSVGHGGEHLLPAFVSPSPVLPVIDGRVALGTWQSVVIVEPTREHQVRTLRLSFLPG